MNKLSLLISLCIFSSASWSDCIGDCVNGYGTYSFSGEWDGQKYVGQWQDDEANGQGTFTWPDGDKYVGQFKDDKKNGQGTHTWADGRKYVGQFKDDEFNGQGTLTSPDGENYVGQFKDDEFNGQGTYTYEDGSKDQGQWKDGNYVSGQAENVILAIQKQLIEYQYLGGIANGIAGRNTSIALERFYQDIEIIRPSLDDYTTISEDLNANLMNADGICSNNLATQSKYLVCFSTKSVVEKVTQLRATVDGKFFSTEPHRTLLGEPILKPVQPESSVFAVQLATFKKLENARAFREKLRAEGSTAFVSSFIDISRGANKVEKVRYRVAVGPLLSDTVADEIREVLAKKYDVDGIVVDMTK